VKRIRLDVVGWIVTATLVFAAVALALPGDRRIAFHIYILVVGAIVMSAVISAVTGAVPRDRRSQLERALDAKPDPRHEVDELLRMERVVTMGVGSAIDLHTRLLPLLRDIAAARLERQGRRPGPTTLGRWWDLLRPDRDPPADRFAPGIPEAQLRELVADLGRM
jgi:hypothetical protein